jgi:hypothetical protein
MDFVQLSSIVTLIVYALLSVPFAFICRILWYLGSWLKRH